MNSGVVSIAGLLVVNTLFSRLVELDVQVAVGAPEPVVEPLLTALLVEQVIAAWHQDDPVLVLEALETNGAVLKLTEDLQILVLLE